MIGFRVLVRAGARRDALERPPVVRGRETVFEELPDDRDADVDLLEVLVDDRGGEDARVAMVHRLAEALMAPDVARRAAAWA